VQRDSCFITWRAVPAVIWWYLHRPRTCLQRRKARAGAPRAEDRRRDPGQRESLQSLERLRLLHAVGVFTVAAGLLTRSVYLWQQGQITTGDMVPYDQGFLTG
jgi:hypothetical protein